MPDFITRNGKKIPITGKKAGGGTVAAVLVGAVALGGAGGVAVGGGAVGGVGASAGQGVQLSRAIGQSKRAARRGQHDDAWRKLGLRSARKTVERHAECAVHSYGDVQRFFLTTPCRELQRMLFAVPDDRGNTIVVSVAWVRMRDTRDARELRDLADTYGTGNVSPIGGAVLGLGGVPFTGRYYESRRSRSTVVIAEAEPAAGNPHPDVLHAVADVAAQFPPP